ncbi:class F sortase [Streptomyces lavendofoliae]|uniref:Class F sortase n=1 Tax=Streptomyces lavendofoliae TaxID=67314 RepID=A0A918HXN3_9ACTN|nr:class F sortase [Streptomyces lavendofoliae]GGU36284.1 class F sortase [Streptomyces lavendofoliae]
MRLRLAAALLALAVPAALAGCGAARGGPPVTPGAPSAPPAHVEPATAPPAAAAAPLARSEPVRVEIPAAGVDTGPVLDLGLAADGTVEVPSVADADRIGWYDKGVTPGETGPAVLIGHFDTARGPAVLKDVAKVRTGDEIRVRRADGTTAVFRVRELEQVDKKVFPTRKVYGDTARPELRLITCGGELVDGHRPDNIILYADLVV